MMLSHFSSDLFEAAVHCVLVVKCIALPLELQRTVIPLFST